MPLRLDTIENQNLVCLNQFCLILHEEIISNPKSGEDLDSAPPNWYMSFFVLKVLHDFWGFSSRTKWFPRRRNFLGNARRILPAFVVVVMAGCQLLVKIRIPTVMPSANRHPNHHIPFSSGAFSGRSSADKI